MNLVQKLPIGLSLVCLMIMASCSKEDVQAPAPKVESTNTNSNLKVDASAVPPSLASTKGYMGEGILPVSWSRNNVGYSSDLVKYPTGVSGMARLWGDPSLSFVQSMPLIPWAANITSFITVTTSGTWDKTRKASVKTTIKNLKPGKKYALTVYVASSLPKAIPNKPVASFAKSCLLSVGKVAPLETVVDLTNYKNCWVQKVITFTAVGSEADFAFSASPDQNGPYSYAHLLVADNALKEVN